MSDTQKTVVPHTQPDAAPSAPDTVSTNTGPPAVPDVDPELIPEKYRREDGSVDLRSLLTRYSQLESKLGAPPADPPPPADAEGKPDDGPPMLTQEALQPYVHEYLNTGRLSDASYDQLARTFRADRSVVDQVLEAARAQQAAYRDAVFEAAGGAEAFEEIRKWANATLSNEQAAWYESQIHGGDPRAAAAAVRDLQALAGQTKPGPMGAFVQGVNNQATAVAPFRSVDEYRDAMRAKDSNGQLRYENDASYRRDTDARYAAYIQQTAR